MAVVETGARLHFGFQNLSLAHDRLYGGIGVGLDEPRIRLEATRAGKSSCDDEAVRPYVESAVDVLGVPGARVTVTERFERHAGLGSGTQLALASLSGVAAAYGLTVEPRALAPELDRGGRSGVGVATFETGGFVVDAGHPTERFTARTPAPGEWTVPEPIAVHELPEDWRFVLVTPDVAAGRSGDEETASMQTVVERATPSVADDIAAVLTRELLPAVAEADLSGFGGSLDRIGRLNGAWYADEQGGVYRPPAGTLVEELRDSPAVFGAGQSSWGPTVYGVTCDDRATEAARAAESALATADVGGRVRVVAASTSGHVIS